MKKTAKFFTIIALLVSFFVPISEARSKFPVDLDPEIDALARQWNIYAGNGSYDVQRIMRQWHENGLLAEEPNFESFQWFMFENIGMKVWTTHFLLQGFLTDDEIFDCLGIFKFYGYEFPQTNEAWEQMLSRDLYPLEMETILARAATKLAGKSDHVPSMISTDEQFLLRDGTQIVHFYPPWENGASRILDGTIRIQSALLVVGDWYDIYLPYQQTPITLQCGQIDTLEFPQGILELPQAVYNLDGGLSIHHHDKTIAQQYFANMIDGVPAQYFTVVSISGTTQWYGVEKTVDQSTVVPHNIMPRVNVVLSGNNSKATIMSEVDTSITGGQVFIELEREPYDTIGTYLSFSDGASIEVRMVRSSSSENGYWYNFQLEEPFPVVAGVAATIEFTSMPAPIGNMILWIEDGPLDILVER